MSDPAHTAPSGPPPNIIKCRDDPQPLLFDAASSSTAAEPQFQLRAGSTSSWAKPGDTVGREQFRSRIEPWLTALCQSEHISLLLGSGLSNAVHRVATGNGLPGMASADFGSLGDIINAESARSAAASGRKAGNIEDQIRSAHDLLRGLEILSPGDAKSKSLADTLRGALESVLASFAESIRAGEAGLATATTARRESAFNYLVSFLMSFASRTGTRERLHIFTTNYDRFIEAGADAAGLHLLDRFVGSVAPVFRSSRLNLDIHYNPPGIRGEPRYLEGVARFTKLHGSLDWFDWDRSIRRIGIPFGAKSLKPFLDAQPCSPISACQLMIYPNAAKDRETAAYPYVELFRDFAASSCRPNHTLVCFGYGFGDDHINRVIEDMLSIPSTHLVVISYNDPIGRIIEMYERLGRHAQISLLIGDHLGEFQSLVDNYLPKPAIDRTTFRMAELLKSRWGTKPDHASASPLTESASKEEL